MTIVTFDLSTATPPAVTPIDPFTLHFQPPTAFPDLTAPFVFKYDNLTNYENGVTKATGSYSYSPATAVISVFDPDQQQFVSRVVALPDPRVPLLAAVGWIDGYTSTTPLSSPFAPTADTIYDRNQVYRFQLASDLPAFPAASGSFASNYTFVWNDGVHFGATGQLIASANYTDAIHAWESQVDQLPIVGMEAFLPNNIAKLGSQWDAIAGDMRVLVSFPAGDGVAPGAVLSGQVPISGATIVGSPHADMIFGLGRPGTYDPSADTAPPATTFVASPGADGMLGGDGNDTFDYQRDGFAGFTIGMTQSIDGAGESLKSELNRSQDLLRLPGAPGDYRVRVLNGPAEVTPWGNKETLTAEDWAGTTTEVARAPLIGPATQFINTHNIERVEFNAALANAVFTIPYDGRPVAHGSHDMPTMPTQVALTANLIYSEMLQLTSDVYRPVEGFIKAAAERLAYQPGGNTEPSVGARSLGWHPVSAMELGMKPADYSEHGNLRYSFADGFYSAQEPNRTFEGDTPVSNALVLSGLVTNKQTLAIAIRGTDQTADAMDFVKFKTYFDKFAPLLNAVKTYLEPASGHGIEQVLISGHSLGAAMVQYFMKNLPDTQQYKVKAYTAGSPGADDGQASDDRIVNLLHTEDVVTKVPAVSNSTPASVIGIPLALLFAGSGIGSQDLRDLALGLIIDSDSKHRIGGQVHLNSEISDSIGGAEHKIPTYVHDAVKLQQIATDEHSPFYSYGGPTGLAASLRSGVPYHGPAIQLAVGHSGNETIRPLTADDLDLGGEGNDNFFINQTIRADARPQIAAKETGRIIDGGPGVDRITFGAVQSAEIKQSTSDNITHLTFHSTATDRDLFDVGTLTRIELLVFPNNAGGTEIVPVNGFVLNPQKPAPGQTTLQVDPAATHTDASEGHIAVTGTNGNDLIFVGPASSVNGGAGDDTITVRGLDLPTQDNDGGGADGIPEGVAMVGGDGADILVGGPGNDALEGGPGADEIDGGEGSDVASYAGERNQYGVVTYRRADGVLQTDVRHLAPDMDDMSMTDDGADALSLVDRLQFADHTFGLAGAQANKTSSLAGTCFDDVLIQNDVDGLVYFAKMVDGAFQEWGAATGALGGDWKAIASGDVNPSALQRGAETFVQQQSTGTIYYASLDAGDVSWGVVSTDLTPDWKLRAVADVNGDASVDAVVQNEGSGTIYYADMRGGTFQTWGVVNPFLTADWVAVGAGDMNGDGFADVLVQQQSTGTTYFADMAGGQFAGWGVVSTTLTADWRVRAVADVTGDGLADAIFQNSVGGGGVNPGTTYFADLSTGTVRWGVVTTTVDADWVAQGTADVDNDGYVDVLFQNSAGGNGINPGTTYYANMGPGGFEGWGAIATSITADWHAL